MSIIQPAFPPRRSSDLIADTLNLAKERGYTTTLFGRKTHFPRLKSSNPNERAGSERAAINAPIQRTSALVQVRRQIGRAHVRTPVTSAYRIPSSARKNK